MTINRIECRIVLLGISYVDESFIMQIVSVSCVPLPSPASLHQSCRLIVVVGWVFFAFTSKADIKTKA